MTYTQGDLMSFSNADFNNLKGSRVKIKAKGKEDFFEGEIIRYILASNPPNLVVKIVIVKNDYNENDFMLTEIESLEII